MYGLHTQSDFVPVIFFKVQIKFANFYFILYLINTASRGTDMKTREHIWGTTGNSI